MKVFSRKQTILILTAFLVVLTLCLTACGVTNDQGGEGSKETEKTVVKIEIDEQGSDLTGYVGEYDISHIRLLVYYSDGDVEMLNVENSFISTSDRTKLNKTGPQTLQINYGKCHTPVTIVLSAKPKNKYSLSVVGGLPTLINGKAFTDEVTLINGRFVASYDEGTVVTLQWTAKTGYAFKRWIDNGSEIDSPSTFEVTMNEKHDFVAEDYEIVHTVTFYTNCSQPIYPHAYDVLNESALPTLERDGYVFDGWTKTPVKDGNEIDCDAEKISFPYPVTMDTELYGTWRELGLEYDSNIYVSSITGKSGYKILNYSRNDKVLNIPEKHNDMPILAISADAFIDATALEELFISKQIEYIETGFVRNCARLKSITVDGDNAFFSDDSGVLLNSDGDELVAYPAGLINALYEPDGIKRIRDYALYNAVIGGVVLPASVLTVGQHAFDSVHIDYVNLSALNPHETGFSLAPSIFNGNVSSLLVNAIYLSEFRGMSAFAGFSEKVTDDPTVPDISVNPSRTLLYKTIFNENSENTVTTVEIIGADRSMTALDLPDKLDDYPVSSIGYAAFNGCIYLNTFSIGRMSQLERILDKAFDGTPYKDRRLADDGSISANNILYKYLGDSASYTLQRGITTIAEGAFRGNKTLQYLVLTSNNELEFIGPYAFYGCENFVKSYQNSAYDNGIKLKKGVTTIGNYAFAHSGILALELFSEQSELTKIGKMAFYDCKYLKSVTIGPKTEEIENDAFLYCYSLQSFSVLGMNSRYISYSGVLYSKSVNSTRFDTLFAYPSGKLSAEFNVNAPGGAKVVDVVYIADYALFYANILSLYLPDTVRNISSSAIYVPGLVGVLFETINPGITYDDMFIKTDETLALEKWEPEYITVTDLTVENTEQSIDTYFDDDSLRTAKYVESASTTYLLSNDNKMIFRVRAGNVSVARFDRISEEADVPDEVDGKNVYAIDSYAFTGYYLKTLTLGKLVQEINSHALSDAYSLQHLFTDVDATAADVEEDSFGESFNNGLYVYIDPERTESYVTKWDADEKYLLDINEGKPKVTFKYLEGEEADPIAPIYGAIAANAEPRPVRTGYDFVGWRDANEDLVDFSEEFNPPYNITLYCMWAPKEYTVRFVIGNNATMTETDESGRVKEVTEKVVKYDTTYKFPKPQYNDKSQELDSWKLPDKSTIPTEGKWLYLADTSEIVLYAVWTPVDYELVYAVGEDVTVANVSKCVNYGQPYTLDVPTRVGYIFNGWSLTESGNDLLTDENGVSLLPWQENGTTTYNIYAKWSAVTGITVSLYFNGTTKYKDVEITFGESFSFPYNINDMEEEWRAKQDLFCGWYGAYDAVAESGIGKRYTDETGNGLFAWDVGHDVDLYAQWPTEITDGAVLETLTGDDLSRSYVLKNNITVTRPIGSGSEPYTGTFNGAGYTVTFTYSVDSSDVNFDGYVGLFAYNKGTLKNIVLQAQITVDATGMPSGKELFIGTVAGRNDGDIQSVSSAPISTNANLTVLNPNNLVAYVGGMVGYHCGMLSGGGMVLNPLSVSVGNNAYFGLVFGSVVEGEAVSGGGAFVYKKSSDDDPYADLPVCGSIDNAGAVTIAMSFQPFE